MRINRSRTARYHRLLRLSSRPLPALTVLHARRYLADYPDDGRIWLILGLTLTEMARYEEAEQALHKAIELCPPDQLSVPLDYMGHLFRESGDYEQAAGWYRQAIEADPDDATSHIFLGAVLARQGRLHDALEAHRVATTCGRGCIDDAYLHLGLVLRALGRFHEAADCFREALRQDPKYQEARRALHDVERCIAVTRQGGAR
jgi:tetratricopeptide (TPR) repeat protein